MHCRCLVTRRRLVRATGELEGEHGHHVRRHDRHLRRCLEDQRGEGTPR